MNYDVAIIGAGPAGLIAAGRVAELGAKVALLEKNLRPGNKLLLTGKERCNLANAEENMVKFAEAMGKKGKFLYSCLQYFGVADTLAFFQGLGIKTKLERGNRVFPESDKALDVLNALLKYVEKPNVTLMTNTAIKSITSQDNKITSISSATNQIVATNYILCTGGLSYPSTGSNGEGYRWAEKLGHTIVPPEPCLVAVCLNEPWLKEVQALELKNVRVSVYQNNKKFEERFGEAMFTHEGISGPIVIDMSKKIGEYLHKGEVIIEIDLKPALSFDEVDKRVLRDFETYRTKQFKNSLNDLLPRRLIPVMISKSEINPDKIIAEITKAERARLVSLLKSFKMKAIKLAGFEKAIITTGGISLREIDPQTMRSNIIPNLYFAGEIIDLDGPTGGYNLQICWSTGYTAGSQAAMAAEIIIPAKLY